MIVRLNTNINTYNIMTNNTYVNQILKYGPVALVGFSIDSHSMGLHTLVIGSVMA